MCILIPLEQFCKIATNVSSSSTLDKIAIEMKNTYRCFGDDIDNRRYPSKAPPQKIYHHQERVRIGNRVLSKEMIARKEFMMYANKLSIHNKETIVKAFKSYIRKECVDIYVNLTWDLMLRAPEYQELYLYFISSVIEEPLLSAKLNCIYKMYVSDRLWYPPKSIDITEEDYDEFCDFVKWKKSALASINAWNLIVSKKLVSSKVLIEITEYLIDDLDCELSTNESIIGNRILETLLEELLTIIKLQKMKDTLSPQIATFLKTSLKLVDKLKPATKFKLLDIEKAFNE